MNAVRWSLFEIKRLNESYLKTPSNLIGRKTVMCVVFMFMCYSIVNKPNFLLMISVFWVITFLLDSLSLFYSFCWALISSCACDSYHREVVDWCESWGMSKKIKKSSSGLLYSLVSSVLWLLNKKSSSDPWTTIFVNSLCIFANFASSTTRGEKRKVLNEMKIHHSLEWTSACSILFPF